MEQENETRQESRRRRLHLEMSGTNLKIYGCITMLFYTVSMSIIQNGIIHINQYDTTELSQALKGDPGLMLVSGWASVFQLIGGLAVPVFAFLLVEGFLHTSSFRRYLLTMLGFAVISEVPYDLAMNDTLWTLASQNVLFTYAICLILLYGLRLFVGKKGARYRLIQIVMVIAAILWSSFLKCAFGLCSIMLTAVYYLFYDMKGVRLLVGCGVSAMYVTAPLSGYALWNYTGDRGWNKNKYVFYILYPLHLLILGLIAHFMAA